MASLSANQQLPQLRGVFSCSRPLPPIYYEVNINGIWQKVTHRDAVRIVELKRQALKKEACRCN